MDEASADADAALAPSADAPASRAPGDSAPTASLLQIAEHSNDLVAISDADGRLTYLNAAGRRLAGRAPTGRVEGDLADLFDPADRAQLAGRLLPAAREGGVAEAEVRVLNPASGARADLALSIFALRDPLRGLTGLVTLGRDRTEEKRERERLARNAETFHRLIADNPFGVYLVDQDFRLRIISRGARKVFGGVDEPIGRDFAEVLRIIWPEPFASEAIDRFRQTLATGTPYIAPLTIERRADILAEEAYDWRIEQIALPEGGHGVVCYFYDLSERQAFERELDRARSAELENGRQLDALYSEAPLGLGLIDREFRFVRINAALAAMNGIAPEAHIGKVVWDLVPDLRASAEPMLHRVLDTGEPIRDVIVRGSTPADPDRIHEWAEQFYPFRDSAGEVVGVGVIADDVTDRFAAVRELAAREDELRRVLNQLFAFVGILDPDGRVTYANNAPLEAAGLALGDVEGRDFADAPWWSYDPAVQQRLREAIAAARAGQTVRYDVPVMLGHDLVTIDFQIAPLRDAAGQIAGLVPSGAIIEERVRAEAALRELTQNLEAEVERRTAALEDANRQLTREIRRREAAQAALAQSQKLEALGQLTSGIAHDFNNLLAAITGGLTLIERRIADDTIRLIAGHSKAAAFRGAKLIKQMLAFARQEVLEPRAVNLPGLVAEIETLVGQAVPGSTVDLAVPADLPAVLVDQTLLEAALLNLAVNAADAMPAGGTLRITAEALAPGDARCPPILAEREAVALCVADTGCGIAPDILSRVLEPFYTTKAAGKGTGLGLAMVHGFVTQSGGDMTIASVVGEGTSVTLFLPCAGTDGDGSAGIDPAADEVRLGEGAILLVDDDEDVRAITAAQLRSIGYRVVEADGMAGALAALDAGAAPDLVLTDVVMPGGDGIALAQAVAARGGDLPVLFMTGRADTARLEGRPVLHKPFDLARLSRAVAAAL